MTIANQIQESRTALHTLVIKPRQKKGRLIDALVARSSIGKAVDSSRRSILDGKLKLGKIVNPFSSTRQQQLQEVTSDQSSATAHPIARRAGRNFRIATINLLLATTGALFFAPLYLLSTLCLFYITAQIFRDAYGSLVKEQRISGHVLDALIVGGAVVSGFFFTASLGCWMAMLTRLMMSKTEDHSRQSLRSLFDQQIHSAWVVVDGVEVEIPIEEVQIGNIIAVSAGQTIAVDGVITSGTAAIDQHMLTGEAQPAEKEAGDQVLAATLVLAGQILIRVERSGQETVASQIGVALSNMGDYKLSVLSKAEGFIDKVAPPTLLISLAALLTAGVGSMLGVLWSTPGSKVRLLAPISMLNFLQIAAQNHILVKDGRSLESLQDVDTIVFDKTGTLTLEQPIVSALYPCNGATEAELLQYAATAEHRQTHPIAQAILGAASQRGLPLLSIDDVNYEIGYGVKVTLQGQDVYVGSERFMTMAGIALPHDIHQQQAICHEQGRSLVMVSCDGRLMGGIELQATIRPEAQDVIRNLQERGLQIWIISGDQEASTSAMAQMLGVDGYFANVLPEAKAKLVAQMQDEGKTVCFVGDGINDSLALQKADVSISLSGATTIAIDTAQIVLMDQSLQQIPHLFDLVHTFNRNLKSTFAAAIIPDVLCIAGALFLHWGFLATVLINQAGALLAFANVTVPLLTQTDDSDHPGPKTTLARRE